MGSGRFDAGDWLSYSSTRSYDAKTKTYADTRTAADIFKTSLDPSLNPKGVTIRESRDSVDNPESNAIIIAQDITGSMGMISHEMAKTGIPTLVTEIYARRPVTDPHIMCMAIGDVESDSAPLQITQFEADTRIAEQLEKFYLEGNGGGNEYESYALAWYFAAHHTSIDCFEKRGKKGYLFTIGDEEPTRKLSKESIEKFLGYKPQTDVDMNGLLTLVSRKYEVFHIIVDEGSHARACRNEVHNAWINLLAQRTIHLTDHTKIGQVIVSAIEVLEGKDKDKVASSWDGSTAMVVSKAVKDLTKISDSNSGVVTL